MTSITKKYVLTAISFAFACWPACGGGSSANNQGTVNLTPVRGDLLQNQPPRITSLTTADLTASLKASATGQGFLAVAGIPTCGVDVPYIQYGTVNGAGEATDASGVLMTPSGGANCTGARPVVL